MTPKKILVIRRENIGDLICTTPLIRALRNQLPDANIQALVSRYNVPVLYGNSDLDEIHSYQKAKHRQPDEGVFQIYWDRLKTVIYLRKQQFDWILLPGGPHASAIRFARMISPKNLLIRGQAGNPESGHEVERTCHMLTEMGLAYETPNLRLALDDKARAVQLAEISSCLGFQPKKVYGIHLSARKVSQQWPVENFISFVKGLRLSADEAVAIFWAPGSSEDSRHPGDDDKAHKLLDALVGMPVVPIKTNRLEELISGLSVCSALFCSDGGAMHVAAALDIPIVCMFGRSDPEQWGPWGVPQRVLLGEGQDVRGVTPVMALSAMADLQGTNKFSVGHLIHQP